MDSNMTSELSNSQSISDDKCGPDEPKGGGDSPRLTMSDVEKMLQAAAESADEQSCLYHERLQDAFYPLEDWISLHPEYGDDYAQHRLTPEYRAWRDRHFKKHTEK